MYESLKGLGALGWSDHMPGGEFVPCQHVVGGVKKCFTTTAGDRQCAENSNCFELRAESCTTTSGGTGKLWCCPRHLPPPPGNPCTPQSTAMVCRRHDARCSSFSDRRRHGICLIQKALCDVGIDAGPIDGHGTSDMYPIALRMFQARNNIDTTGRPDVATRAKLRVGPDAAAADDDEPRPGEVPDLGSISYFWPIAFSASSLFLMFSWWKFGRRGGRR